MINDVRFKMTGSSNAQFSRLKFTEHIMSERMAALGVDLIEQAREQRTYMARKLSWTLQSSVTTQRPINEFSNLAALPRW